MKTNKEVLTIARRHIGQNGGRFRKFCGLPSGAAWCNAYVDYVADEGGVSSLYFNGKKETYCPHSIEWCKKNLAQIPLYLAMPMDIIYFDWEKNGVPNHIGLVVSKKTTSSIRTIEGNTDGGKVAEKTRNGKYVQGVFRPHYKHSITLGQIKVDGNCGYNTIANLQRALGGLTIDGILGKQTVKRLQQFVAVGQDGAWCNNTSKTVQKMLKANGFYTGSIDGEFGVNSVKALQKWINKKNMKAEPQEEPPAEPTPQPVKTKAQQIIELIDHYAWPKGTKKKKWKYKTGKARKSYKSALKKYMKHSAKISQSDCGYFVSTPIRALGIDKKFDCLDGTKWDYSKAFKIVHKGKKIPKGLLKPGDIIRYRKKSGQHTMYYYGNGKIAEAQRGHAFPKIKKDTKKYNKSNVRKKTIEVLRVKG